MMAQILKRTRRGTSETSGGGKGREKRCVYPIISKRREKNHKKKKIIQFCVQIISKFVCKYINK